MQDEGDIVGEITLSDKFGQCIAKTIRDRDYRHNLEIGSYDGSGSTQCFIEGMRDMEGDKRLTCLEIDKERFAILQSVTSPWSWVACFNESSIRKSDIIPKSFDEVWDSPHNNHLYGRKEYPKNLVFHWYSDDMKKFSDDGYLPKVMAIGGGWDAVLIDGCEFTGYSEYSIIKDSVKCLFLDDVFHAYKCAQIYNELINDEQWELIEEGREVRNGYSVFVKI